MRDWLSEDKVAVMCPILFTCTTFLSKPGKYEQLVAALDSVLKLNMSTRIRKFLVINEYSDTRTEASVSRLRRKYPAVHFVCKTADQQGQARSLNMILDELEHGGYKYWLQWEESWVATRYFVDLAFGLMERHDIDQLQLTANFTTDSVPSHHLTVFDDFHNVRAKAAYPPDWRGGTDFDWPLFSLRPGMNRVAAVLKTGRFDERAAKWPIAFEYDYAMDWVKLGHKKAVLREFAATRSLNHKSTYESASPAP